MENFDILGILKNLPAVILGLTIHEYAHAYTANRLGDPTARDLGRMTLNPVKHIDPLGFFFILIAGFGWAKPVLINPEYLKKKHRDEILISLAGPFSNLLLGILFFILARILYSFDFFVHETQGKTVIQFILMSGIINFGLFIFNLLPIPPLDGSHIYLTYLKKKNERLFNLIYKYGTLVLLGIVIFESQSKMSILPIHMLIGLLTDFLLNVLQFN